MVTATCSDTAYSLNLNTLPQLYQQSFPWRRAPANRTTDIQTLLGLRAQFDISLFADVTPGTLMRNLDRDITGVKHAIRDLKKDLLAFNDIKNIKVWLKDMRRQSIRGEFDDLPS